MSLLSGFLFILAGIIFHKAWSSMLELGILFNAADKVAKQLLVSLVLIEQDIQTIIEHKKLALKEKGLTDEQIDVYITREQKTFFMWREKVVLTLINNFPQEYRNKCLPFNDWLGAASYLNTIVKKNKVDR